MLVVSNIDLPIDLPLMQPSAFLETSIKDFTLNINNDYRYLKIGYYVSLHAEILGNKVIPSSANIIDAYRTPIFLLRAMKAGIRTTPFLVTSSVKQIISELNFPVVVFAVNPFSYEGFRIAENRSALYRAVKSLSMNYKFAVCAQPLLGKMLTVKSIFGRSATEKDIGEIAKKVYQVFNIPLCNLHVQRVGKDAYLCGLQPLKQKEISANDLEVICKEIKRIFIDNGGCLVG
ncbi:MAG: RimK-like ATPgrasp N-terminal domain-containing protein [Candidatus Bathyarchaeia archaeon]